MNKKDVLVYETPRLEIVRVEALSVIRTSGEDINPINPDDPNWTKPYSIE